MLEDLLLDPVARARALIARIRQDIAIAWEQIEAGRAILARSAWLVARWHAEARAPSIVAELGSGRPSVAGMFVEIEEEPRPPRRRGKGRPVRRRAARAYPVV